MKKLVICSLILFSSIVYAEETSVTLSITKPIEINVGNPFWLSELQESQKENHEIFSSLNETYTEVSKELVKLSDKIDEKKKYDFFTLLIVPLISLLLSLIVIIVNYLQNKKRNQIDVITKSRVEWINNLRLIMSDYITELSKLTDNELINKYFNAIHVYLNPNEESVKVIFLKLSFIKYLSKLYFDNNEFIQFSIELVKQFTEEKQKTFFQLASIASVNYQSLNEYQVFVFNQYLQNQMNDNLQQSQFTESIKKLYHDKDNDINDRFSKINSEISTINDTLKNTTLDEKYRTIKSEFNSYSSNLKTYLQEEVCKNISESFNSYLKNEWDKVKNEVETGKKS